MTKTDFLDLLARRLKPLSKADRQHFLDYYAEMLEDLIEDGRTEEEAVAYIGSPSKIADEILEEHDIFPAAASSKVRKILVGVLLVLGFPLWGSIALAAICLIASAALLILCAYLIIWCVPVMTGSISAASLILAVVGMLGVLPLLAVNTPLAVLQLGIAVIFAGLFILAGLFTWNLGKYFITVTNKFTLWLKRLLQKRRAVA